MTRDYRTLDAILICASIVAVAALGCVLAFVTVPQANLPILASLGTGVLGILTAYVGARWGNKKPSSEDAGSVTATAPPGGTVSASSEGPKP